MKIKLPPIPKFKNYQEEVAFWKTHNLTDYIGSSSHSRNFYQKDLKKNLTVRFSIESFMRLKKLAAKKGLRVTTLIRQEMLKLLAK